MPTRVEEILVLMVSVLFNDSVFDLFIQEDAFDCNANLLHIGPKEWTRFSSNEQKVPCSSCAHVECFSCISDKERQRERVCVLCMYACALSEREKVEINFVVSYVLSIKH